MGYAAKILADSVSAAGHRLTTMEVTFPRIVLAEFNTHRMLSRNSASSRAIPVAKQLARIKESPFIPVHFGSNQPGMQAGAELEGEARQAAVQEWLAARDSAVVHVERLLELGLHKQITNRLLEPFMWHTVIVTATEWSNFFALRANEMAQPEIRVIAEMMQDLYLINKPRLVNEGGWHLPLIQPDERDGIFEFSEGARKISAARCCRVSYLTHDGKRDLSADLELYHRLVTDGHMSPLEHVATPFGSKELRARYGGGDEATDRVGTAELDEATVNRLFDQLNMEFSGNLHGWTQLRKFIPNEHDFSLAEKS